MNIRANTVETIAMQSMIGFLLLSDIYRVSFVARSDAVADYFWQIFQIRDS